MMDRETQLAIAVCTVVALLLAAAVVSRLRKADPSQPPPTAPTPGQLLMERLDEPAFRHRVFLLLLAAAAACAAAICALIFAFAAAERAPFPQNTLVAPLLLYGGVAGGSAGAAWFWLVRRLLRGHRESLRLQRRLIVFGALSPLVLGMVAAVQINLHWGDEREYVDEAEVVSVDSYSLGGRGRRSGRNLERMTLGAFADGRVPEQSYRSYANLNKTLWPGQRVRVHWRQGALGVPVLTRRPAQVTGGASD